MANNKIQKGMSSYKKFKIFLSSSFQDMAELRSLLINRFIDSGLLYYAMENSPIYSTQINLRKQLMNEIDSSDIFILLVKESLGKFEIDGRSATQFEYEYALMKNKPILSYFTDSGRYGEFDTLPVFKRIVCNNSKYCRIPSNDDFTTVKILSDIIFLINSGNILSYWVKSDYSSNYISKTINEKKDLDGRIKDLSAHIITYENSIHDTMKRYQLIGPLIEAGLRHNFKLQAIKFAEPITTTDETSIKDLVFSYFIDRFDKYNNYIYDKKMNLFWYFVRDKNFSFSEAKNYAESFSNEKKISWRLPEIRELISLITQLPIEGKYIEKYVVEDNTCWFWSSTSDLDNEKAFYLDSSVGQILKDSIGYSGNDCHKKGLILCTNDSINVLPKKIKRNIDTDKTQIDESFNNFERFVGVYFSSPSVKQLIKNNTINRIRIALSNIKTTLTTFETINSRSGCLNDILINEFQLNDLYILFLDNAESLFNDDQIINRIIMELNTARLLKIPIILISNLTNSSSREIYINLNISEREKDRSIYLHDEEDVSAKITAIVSEYKHQHGGWIKKDVVDYLNQYFSESNKREEKINKFKNEINNFISELNYPEDLILSFNKAGIYIFEPEFGKHTRFISIDNPISRLMQYNNANSNSLPIVYVNIANRFNKTDNKHVIIDNYLNIKWWIYPKKRTTYEEAEKYSSEISEIEKVKWEIPSIKQLMTLLSPFRGERKYMDEIVFPTNTGRWYWSRDLINNDKMAYYLDANYLAEAIRLEDLPVRNEIRKKSVILISSNN